MNKNYKNARPFKRIVFLIIGFVLSLGASSQQISRHYQIKWLPDQYIRLSESDSILRFSFEGSVVTDKYGFLPVFTVPFELNSPSDMIRDLSVEDLVFEPVAESGLRILKDGDRIPESIEPEQELTFQRKISYMNISLLPLRRNRLTGQAERLVSFTLKMEIASSPHPDVLKPMRTYAGNSVLATGTWFKMSVSSTGIYRITSDNLQSMGVDIASLNPHNLRMYGNGGGMLPEANATPRTDDLREIPIMVSGEEDGKFDGGDFILFYGESPDKWRYDTTTHLFRHSKNSYSDVACYFLCTDVGPGKRVGSEPSTSQPLTNFVYSFDDYQFYEKDDNNLIKSGRSWFDGQFFDVTTTRDYTFNFPNIDTVTPCVLIADVAARCTSGPSSFQVSSNNHSILNISIGSVGTYFLDQYANEVVKKGNFKASNQVIDITLTYNKPDISARGWLNYLEINALRKLIMAGSQMSFRSVSTYAKNSVLEYHLTTGSQPVTVWDVTDPGNILSVGTSQVGQATVFRLVSETLHEFIAFDGSSFLSPKIIGRLENQDLHGAGIFDYVIVTNPLFINEAERLASFHREHDNMNVLVTTPEKVYNEFSSGAQDVSAIRDFMKMLYDKSGKSGYPGYLLLFGDASYDYKDRIPDNSNLIPSYESYESLNPVATYVTDDYFVILDDPEGQSANGLLDAGVGRFPVQTVEQAQDALNKIEHYCANSDTVKNDWRNVICFVADDKDDQFTNIHFEQAEQLATMLDSDHKDYNVDKIYLDAYPRLSTPGGNRYPDVNDAINKRVDKGALIMNYTGHGGTLGWAHERVLEIPDIQSWKNFDRLTAFVTATCEFSWFDDPSWVSAGEWVFLNPKGGGIALFTTTRPTYAGENFTLSSNFYSNVLKKTNGKFPKMGDLIVSAKNSTGSSPNSRKFVLLGDPGLQLDYPKNHVVTTSINGTAVTSSPDTLKALAEVTISGEVQDDQGHMMPGFNGTIFPTVFDKAEVVSTFANAGGSPSQFYLRKNPLYKGKVTVTGGQFSFTFIVPKDIAYNYGFGKISYYARDPEADANGYSENIIVGGFDDRKNSDEYGPEIQLYMNDRNFVSGGITNQNPVLLAYIYDSSGVNTVGNGIGHDITAVLDDDTKNASILNDYYVSDLNTFKSGEIGYPYFDLPDGIHHITLKVWDVYNNSAEGTIEFLVVSSEQFEMQNLMNYPNPFTNHTTFSFELNQPDATLDVQVKIFTLSGKLVKSMNQVVYTNGYKVEPFVWDGTGDSGAKIGAGMYVYTISVSLPGGSTVQNSSKLVYFH